MAYVVYVAHALYANMQLPLVGYCLGKTAVMPLGLAAFLRMS